jgi:hypothetical protein
MMSRAASWRRFVAAFLFLHITKCCWCYHLDGDENVVSEDLSINVKVGVLGLKPKENVTALQKKCDKVLYEQVALRLALEHIRDKNSSIIDDLHYILPGEIITDPIYTSKQLPDIVGNTTLWAKNNIIACAQHELMYDLGEQPTSVMLHETDNLPDTVDMILGPRDAVNYECQMMRQIAALGQIPMVTWGCTMEELGEMSGNDYVNNSTTISMLPENAENLHAHAILDFLHENDWDKDSNVAFIYQKDDGKALQLIQNLNAITSCNNTQHNVKIHGYGLPINEARPLNEYMERIKSGDYNILISTLKFIDLPEVLYEAYCLGMVGNDNIWIHTNDFTPTQLNASTNPVERFVKRKDVVVQEEDKDLVLGQLLHGSFVIGWTAGGADYSSVQNPWERFKQVWSEQSPGDYPDLGLPQEFFDYPPLSASAALVYDSAFIALTSYFHNLINSPGFYDARPAGQDNSHDHGSHDHGNSSSSSSGGSNQGDFSYENDFINEDFSPDHHNHHPEGEEVHAHMHVCANSQKIPGGLKFNGVTGPVHISKTTKARVPVANIFSVINLQWIDDDAESAESSSSLLPFSFGKWPHKWDNSWGDICNIPLENLWQRTDPVPLKYGTSETRPAYRSNYSQTQEQNQKQKRAMIIGIVVLMSTLGVLSVGCIFLLLRYQRAHKRIIKNEKVVNDFQFEWETNAGKALAMMDNLIDTAGEQKSKTQKKEAFEKKLAQIRRFLLAQDARVEMNQVKSSIERVGAERYTPEVTAYLMAHALNISQEEEDENGDGSSSVLAIRSDSLKTMSSMDKSDFQHVIEKTLSIKEREMPSNLKSSFSATGSNDSLDAISPVVDSVMVEQVRTKLISSLNTAATGNTTFDVFELAALTGDRPLSTLTLFLLHRRGVCTALKLNMDKMIAFLVEVENNMLEHPYHNRRHVADVVAGLHAFTLPGGCLYDLVSKCPLAMLAAIFAAAVHDLQHPGVNNNFLSKTLHPLAIRYSDKSINENHHLSCAFDLLAQDEFNFMEGCDLEDFIHFRALVIDMVLATDMKSHFAILDSFRRFEKARKEDPNSCKDRCYEIRNVFPLAMKIADLIHCARPLEVHHRWVDLITEEFFIQGDLEKGKEMKLSPGMDRSQSSGPLQQVGFTEIFVLPLFKTWRDYSREFGSQEGRTELIYYTGVEKNYQYWLHASKNPPASST